MAATPKLSPTSFFFTDPGAITQNAAQAFGPVSADQFRLTNKFSVTSGVNAYAVCMGVALVQPQAANTALVNLILRPFKQPITGFNIKYFIYRGLNASDFFSGDNVIPASSTTSEFINKINESFTAYYTNTGQTAPAFVAKYIGFDPANQPSTTLISDLFFKTTEYTSQQTETDQTAFELPMVTAGESLGKFAAGECGIDIVIDYGDYKLPAPNDQFVFDLEYARAAEKIIDLTLVTGDFKKKLLKEQIFQFLDAAAYYGFHYTNGSVSINNNGTTERKTGIDIYNNVIQNFSTKNSFYLYIQSDRTRSYNFYGNYIISDTNTNTLKIGVAEDALTESTYHTNGWPLLIFNTPQPTNNSNNTLYLQFVTDNNDNTVLYGQVAQIVNAQGNNFCGPDNLRLPADTVGNVSNLTKVIQLANAATGAQGTNNYVATFNILIYEGKKEFVVGQTIDINGNTIDVTAEANFFDDVFDNLDADPEFKPGNSNFKSVVSQRVKLINHYYDKVQYGVSAVQTTIINDIIDTGDDTTPTLARVTYVSESVDVLNDVISAAGNLTADTKSYSSVSGSVSNNSVTNNDTYILPDPFYYGLITFTDKTKTITGLQLLSTDSTIPSKIILGLTKDENDLLKGLIVANGLVNARLFLVNFFDDTDELNSPESIVYQKYKAGIVGETASGELKLGLCTPDLIIYSTDRKYHFSKNYSDFITNIQAPFFEISGDSYIDSTN
jgi:hypothetical protein